MGTPLAPIHASVGETAPARADCVQVYTKMGQRLGTCSSELIIVGGRTPWSARDPLIALRCRHNTERGPIGGSAADQGVRPPNPAEGFEAVMQRDAQSARNVVVAGARGAKTVWSIGDK